MPKPAMLRQALPRLDLSATDVKTLGDVAGSLVQHNLEQRNLLLVDKEGRPDSRVWREIQRKEGVRVYREQHVGASRQPAGSSASISATGALSCASNLTDNSNTKLPSLLLTASIAGSLDDIMYAVAAASSSALRVKSRFIQDGVVDSKVLCRLADPLVEDPFLTLSVTWRHYAVSEPRDFTCVDATGVLEDIPGRPRDDRIGYHLVHSLDFDNLPDFRAVGVERANMSVCAFFRQRDANVVEVYARGYFDFHSSNDMLNNVALHVLSTQWLSYARLMELAHMKKLLWCIKEHTGRDSFSSSSHSSGDSTANSSSAMARGRGGSHHSAQPVKFASKCTICSRGFGGLMRSSPRACACCACTVCKRCCVKRPMCAVSSRDREVHERKMVFCAQCTTQAAKCSASLVARDELLARRSSMSSTRQTAVED